MARLKDVAHLAGVSVSVASRALTGDSQARINDETRARIHEAAQALKYVPDHRARALRLSRAGAIALVVPEVNNAIFGPLHGGVHGVCEARGSAVLLGQIGTADRRPGVLADLIGKGRVDGVILQRAEEFDDVDLARTIAVDVPVVLFNSTLAGHVGSVVLDDAAAVDIAVAHLRELGHRRIGFIAGAPHHDAAARRLAAFTRAVGPAAERWVQPAGWEAPAGAEAMNRMLASVDVPSAIVVASLNAAVGALSAALHAGVRVPEQLSIVSIQDAWISEFTTPRITAVAMPMALSGARTATMLLDHLETGADLADEVLNTPGPQLINRESSGRAAN